MATVFKFKDFETDDERGKSSNQAFGAKTQSPTDEEAVFKSVGMEACHHFDSPTFDWGQHQDFHFVNIDKHTLHAKRDRHAVRAHVMNDLNKKERLKKKFRSLSASTLTQLQPRPHRITRAQSIPFSTSSTDLDRFKEYSDPKIQYHLTGGSIPSIGSTDPFDVLPLTMPKHVETWLNSYVKVQAPGLVPFEANEHSNPMLTLLLRLAILDTTVMHALVCNSGHQYTSVRAQNSDGWKEDPKRSASLPPYLLHKRHALVAIRKRLCDPTLATSDETIAAILCLAVYEFSSKEEGHLLEYQHHMNGIASLVKLRGGLENLGLKGFLQQLVSWVDLWGSSSSPLKFRMRSNLKSLNPTFEPPTRHPPGLGFNALLEGNHFQRGVKEALHDLALIAPSYSHYKRHTIGQEELILLVGERTSLEQRLVSLIGPRDIADFPLSSDLLHDLCRIAGLLFINRSLRVTETVSIRTTELMRELFCRLPSALVMCNNGECSKILLWTLFVGGTAAMEGSHRKWFVDRLAERRRYFGLLRWGDARRFLVNYLWSEAHCAGSYEGFWNETIRAEIAKAEF